MTVDKNVENIALIDVHLTCVKRRFPFLGSGGVFALRLSLFCPRVLGQFCCFQTLLSKTWQHKWSHLLWIFSHIFLTWCITDKQFHLTNEFVIIYSFGVGGGNVPWVDCVFIIRAICCCPIGFSWVFWGWTACFVILTGQFFVIHFHLKQQLDGSINFSLRKMLQTKRYNIEEFQQRQAARSKLFIIFLLSQKCMTVHILTFVWLLKPWSLNNTNVSINTKDLRQKIPNISKIMYFQKMDCKMINFNYYLNVKCIA